MADELIRLRSSITKFKQYTSDLERTIKKLKNQLKRANKENKSLKDENSRLQRRFLATTKNLNLKR